jgi:hypothetical protein
MWTRQWNIMTNPEIIIGWICVFLAGCGIYFSSRSPETKDEIMLGIGVFCGGLMGLSLVFLLGVLIWGTIKAIY